MWKNTDNNKRWEVVRTLWKDLVHKRWLEDFNEDNENLNQSTRLGGTTCHENVKLKYSFPSLTFNKHLLQHKTSWKWTGCKKIVLHQPAKWGGLTCRENQHSGISSFSFKIYLDSYNTSLNGREIYTGRLCYVSCSSREGLLENSTFKDVSFSFLKIKYWKR